MIEYFKKAFTIYNVLFEGRARRSEYWYFQLVNFLIIVVFYILLFLVLGDPLISGSEPNPMSLIIIFPVYLLLLIYGFVAFVPTISLTVRRLHDIGKSGWFYLVGLIPIIGTIWLIVLLATDSQIGENQYGPNPKGIGNTFSNDHD